LRDSADSSDKKLNNSNDLLNISGLKFSPKR